jgi:hypothetical protein
MPTALIQPPQSGSQATQLKRMGNLRSSSVAPAYAGPPGVAIPGNARHKAAAPSSTPPRNFSDFKSLNSVPSPQTPRRAVVLAPIQRPMILSCDRYEKA